MSEVTQFLERYYKDPVAFVENVLEVRPEPWQRLILEAFARGDRKISIRSGHGVGKTACASWLLLFHILTRIPQKSVCTACTSTQLFDSLFSELKIWIERLPPVIRNWLDYTSERVVLKASPHESFIVAKTARAETPDALQGIHSENVLLVVDEAAAVAEPVYEAAGSSMTSEHACTVLLGNPTRPTGYFYETFHRLSGDWTNFKISCFDSSRVAKTYPEEMAAMYGEDSNVYRTRVLAEFPMTEDDVLISTELVAAAVERDVEVNPDAGIVWGLDVARYGQDSSALCKRKKNHVLEKIKIWNRIDLMELTGNVVNEYEETHETDKPDQIFVDSIGLGAGVVDRMQELGLPVRGINVSETPSSDKYANMRAELWDKAKSWFEQRDCRIPDDRKLISELSVPKYTYNSRGKLKIEAKEEIKKRGLKSPDLADSFVLTMMDHGSGGSIAPWNQPLKRRVAL